MSEKTLTQEEREFVVEHLTTNRDRMLVGDRMPDAGAVDFQAGCGRLVGGRML